MLACCSRQDREKGSRGARLGRPQSGYDASIMVDIARYTATDAIAEGLASQHPSGGRDDKGRALFERLSRLLEHLCAFWSWAAMVSAVGPPRCTCPIVVTTSPSSTT